MKTLREFLCTKEDLELSGTPTKADIESAAEKIHVRWMQNQEKQGHTSHKSPDGKEEYMVDYENLSEPAKKLDRDAVKAVLDALKEYDEDIPSQESPAIHEED